MAKKQRFSIQSVVDDSVLESPSTPARATGSPVAQHLANARKNAKETIERLTRELEEERNKRLEEQKEDGSNRELEAELEETRSRMLELERELSAKPGSSILSLDPKRVRHSPFANRSHLGFEDESFERLVKSLRRNGGNDLPVKVRATKDDPDFDYEVVYGHRRHRASLVAETPLFATVQEVSDAELADLMHLENEREDLSVFEEAFAFKKWIDTGVFESVAELARRLDLNRSGVAQRLAITQLPESVFVALKDPRKLGIDAWRTLCSAFRSENRELIERLADDLAKETQRMGSAPFDEVQQRLRKLLAPLKPSKPKSEVREVALPSGTPLFTAKRTPRGYVVSLDDRGVGEDIQEDALKELELYLRKRLTPNTNK